MLMNFSKEDRELLQEAGAVVDIPRDTKPEVARKLYTNAKTLLTTLRGLAPVIEGRSASRTKRITKADVRAAFDTVPGAPLEEIARWKRSGYSIDTQNALRLAALTQELRYGLSLLAYASQSLRDDDDDFDPADADDKESHERAASFHRNCASKAKTLARCVENHKAADLHNSAAAGGDGDAARSASKRLKS